MTVYIQKFGHYYYPCDSPHDHNEILFKHLHPYDNFYETILPIFEVLAKSHGWDVVIKH